MRYLILSDVHANLIALDAALEAAKGRWEGAVCLGDIVGYGPDPNEVIDRIRSLGAVTIRGNHDKAGSGLDDAADFNPTARSAALWTRAQLRPENRDYLEKLPAGPFQAGDFSIAHGSFRDEDEYIFAPAQVQGNLSDAPSAVSFFGHTHLQGGFTLRDHKVAVLHFKAPGGSPFATLILEPGTTYLLNPGSIGQPRDGDARAAFAIADLPNHLVEFWRVPYDIAAVQKRMRDEGLPETLILRLSVGR